MKLSKLYSIRVWVRFFLSLNNNGLDFIYKLLFIETITSLLCSVYVVIVEKILHMC